MNDRNWGGFRIGSGRKPTGRNTVNLTLTLSTEEAQILKERAKQEGMTVSRFIAGYLYLKPLGRTDELPDNISGGVQQSK